MGTKTLIRLLIALAILGGIAAFFHFSGPSGNVSTITSSTKKKKLYANFPLNDVAKIHIATPEGELNLLKGESQWEVVERDNYPADSETIIDFLKSLWSLEIAQPVTIARAQYGRLHLLAPDDPEASDNIATIVTFSDAEGNELDALWLGKVHERTESRIDQRNGGLATSDAGRYVRTGSNHSVYRVGELFPQISHDASRWLDPQFFLVDDIQSIELVTQDENHNWKLIREESGGDFALENAEDNEELDPAKISAFNSAFSSPRFQDVFVDATSDDANLADTTFHITTFDGFSYDISVGEKSDDNVRPLSLKVSATFPAEREVAEDEKEEDKEQLDQEFSERIESLKEKLATEKAFEAHVYKVRSYLVDPLIVNRADLLKEEEEDADDTAGQGEEIAPGVTLPLPSAP